MVSVALISNSLKFNGIKTGLLGLVHGIFLTRWKLAERTMVAKWGFPMFISTRQVALKCVRVFRVIRGLKLFRR